MPNAEKPRQQMEQGNLSRPIPFEIARMFLSGEMPYESNLVHEGDRSNIYRCYEREEVLPGVERARFRIDYRRYHDMTADKPHQRIHFEYTQGQEQDPDDQRLVAEMHFSVLEPGVFVLEHRYVQPAFRGKAGLGTRLLKVAEGWLAQVAHELQHPVTVTLQTGQMNVIRWLESDKVGYRVIPEQQALLNEIKEYPERFFQDNVMLSEESRRQGTVKDPYTFRVGTEGREMEDAVRLTFMKKIAPYPDL